MSKRLLLIFVVVVLVVAFGTGLVVGNSAKVEGKNFDIRSETVPIAHDVQVLLGDLDGDRKQEVVLVGVDSKGTSVYVLDLP